MTAPSLSPTAPMVASGESTRGALSRSGGRGEPAAWSSTLSHTLNREEESCDIGRSSRRLSSPPRSRSRSGPRRPRPGRRNRVLPKTSSRPNTPTKSSSRSAPTSRSATSPERRRETPAHRHEGRKVALRNLIDQHLFGAMAKDRIPHAPLSNDDEFCRRVYLDLTGRIPTPEQLIAFVAALHPTSATS